MKPSSRCGVAVALLFFAALPAALQGQDPPPLPEGVTQAMVDQGSQLYSGQGNCVACHGDAGAGTPFAPKLDDNEWLNVDGTFESLVRVITEGVPEPKQSMIPMAARGGANVNDEQVRALAAYIWRLANGG